MPRTGTKVRPRGAAKQYVMSLYVTGANQRSQRAIANLHCICEEYLQGQYDLKVVDMYQSPRSAEEERIIAAPTLIKHLPLPVRRMIGDLSQRDRVLLLLDMKRK